MKKILLTGTSGRLGRQLVPMLLERGYGVHAMVHRRELPSAWGSQVTEIRCSLTDQQAVAEAVAGVDVVCHLGALMPPTPDDEIFETNIRGTYHLLQAVCGRKPWFVFASSDAVYCTGWSLDRYTTPVSEDLCWRPVLFYGISKVLGEQMCINYQDAMKVRCVRLRFPTIVEPRDALALFLEAPYRDLLIPDDAGKWDDPSTVKVALEEDGRPFLEHVVDVRDAAQGTLLAIEKESAAGHAFNIAGPAAFTYREVGPWVAERLGAEAVPGRCRGLHSFELSIEKARRVLGYRPQFRIMDSLKDVL
ncbi:MAG: NAD-dependent epimerase/dehydratase family protein [Acidobacteriota bacterium]